MLHSANSLYRHQFFAGLNPKNRAHADAIEAPIARDEKVSSEMAPHHTFFEGDVISRRRPA
jgi:hypothetical protein